MFFSSFWTSELPSFIFFTSFALLRFWSSRMCWVQRRLFVRSGSIFAFSRQFFVIFGPVVLTQAIATAISSQVHSQNRTGGLYLIRIFDFLMTLSVLKLIPIVLGRGEVIKRNRIWSLLSPVAIFGSLSWLEFGHIEYDFWALILAPLLSIVQAIHLVLLRRAQISFYSLNYQNLNESCSADDNEIFEPFSLYYTGFMSMVLVTPAFFSYANSVVPYDASWESIDYMLMTCSVIFMCGYKYSELWLQTHLELYDFCVFEQVKFFIGSCGQWFLQNMAYATIYAGCGKVLFLASIFRYWSQFGGIDNSGTSRKKENE